MRLTMEALSIALGAGSLTVSRGEKQLVESEKIIFNLHLQSDCLAGSYPSIHGAEKFKESMPS